MKQSKNTGVEDIRRLRAAPINSITHRIKLGQAAATPAGPPRPGFPGFLIS